MKVIDKVGPQKSACVVTSNAVVLRAVQKIVEATFSHIFLMVVHGVIILINDMLNRSENSNTLKDSKKVIPNMKPTLLKPVVTVWFV